MERSRMLLFNRVVLQQLTMRSSEPTAEQKEKKAAKSADQSVLDALVQRSKPNLSFDHRKALDKSLLETVNKTPNMAKYLASSFSLSKGQFPHLMKF